MMISLDLMKLSEVRKAGDRSNWDKFGKSKGKRYQIRKLKIDIEVVVLLKFSHFIIVKTQTLQFYRINFYFT